MIERDDKAFRIAAETFVKAQYLYDKQMMELDTLRGVIENREWINRCSGIETPWRKAWSVFTPLLIAWVEGEDVTLKRLSMGEEE